MEEWVSTLESVEAARILKNIKGKYLVQMGGSEDISHESPILYHIQLPSQIQTDWDELPLLPNSIDVVVLVHLLEFIDYPVKLLQEIFQALKPDGQLLIFGFNPWSLWGLKKLFTFKNEIPWGGKFWSRAQVKRWLINLNYSILFSKTFCYGLPRREKPQRQMQLFTETAGQLCLPMAGGMYLVVAKKSVYAPIHGKIIWARRRLVTRRAIEPTTRI